MDPSRYAFIEMAFDFIGNVLKSSDKPEESSRQLAYQLRELTGAGIVAIFEIDECKKLIFTHCNPERKKDLCNSSEINKLACITIEHGDIIDWHLQNDLSQNEGTKILQELHYDISLGVPLQTGKKTVGCILLLNIPSIHGYNLVIDNMKMLSGIMALILRNAMLFDKQEKVIEQRTKALQDAKERAERSEQVKSVFLANMTHEIRTPINGILGFSELLENNNITSYQRKHYTSLIRKNGDHLLSLVNDIIDLSRLESGKVQINENDLNINEIFQDQYDLFRTSTKNKGIKLYYEKISNEEDAWIIGDPLRLTQILANLINNAVKFTNNGNIEYGCEMHEKIITFFVKDSGIGISASQINNIFGRYNQAKPSHAGIQKGMGLGLSIVKGLLDQMNGKIWVESEEGKGSIFRFNIPRKKATKTHSIEKKSLIIPEGNLHGKTFLLAEDDPIVKKYYNVIFEMSGANLITTDNGKDAIQIFKNTPNISLILLDLDMPFMNGLEALKTIRAFDENIPIIIQTSYVITNEKNKSIELGANGFISKPINRQELFNLIHKSLK
jgi:signal transduction histidine kinase